MGSHPVAVDINTQNNRENVTKQSIHRTTQKYIEHKKYIEQHKNQEECGPCPVFAGFTLAFCLTTEEKAQKNLSQGSKKPQSRQSDLSQGSSTYELLRVCLCIFAVIIRHPKRIRRIIHYGHLWPAASLYHIFPHHRINRTISRKKKILTMRASIFSTTSV